jgi:hypothetical protein
MLPCDGSVAIGFQIPRSSILTVGVTVGFDGRLVVESRDRA